MDFDLFVIGCGSAGVRLGRLAAGFGARTAVCEDKFPGGTCVNVGCVPKKLLVYGALFRDEYEDAAGFGWTVEPPRFDWKDLITHKNTEIRRLNKIYSQILERAGARLIQGAGRLVGPHEVEVAGVRYTAEHIVVATGGKPFVPSFEGSEHTITSNEAFELETLPARVLVVGAGYIGVEFATIFHGFGSKVTVAIRGECVLRAFDGEVRSFLATAMQERGIDMRFHTKIAYVRPCANGLEVGFQDGSSLEVDCVLIAAGRTANTAGLGLKELGVELDPRGAVIVDEDFRSTVPSIYGLGDVIDRVQLTPVALEEGTVLARTLFGGEPCKVDYELIPTAVFSTPNVGTVGLTEEQARERYPNLQKFCSTFRPMKNMLAKRQQRTLMKLLVDADTDVVVGCHMVGPDAGEIIQGLAIALRCGATKAQFDATIGIHPTAAEEFVTMRTPTP